jgi:cAMP phosphodiesterase
VIAVDAGAHLASIIRILELDMPVKSDSLPPKGHETILSEGPFAGVRFPHISAKANGLFVLRELLHSFLITHPHLDHIAAMGINTPALEYGREAKTIVALPQCIEAIKTHIFNDSIWPNLSDEAYGVGFVTYRRLVEGGNPRLGYGEARGYVNVCDGLATKCWAVSHGRCRRPSQSHSHSRGDSSGSYFQDHNGMGHGDGYSFPGRRMSRLSDGYGHAPPAQHTRDPSMASHMHPQGPGTPGAPHSAVDNNLYIPVDSSAFFIRNDVTGQEIIVFGDIEPDSVSMLPRNHIVWDDAAPKFVNGSLKAIFIECSFDDSVRDTDLYGHLCPRHLVAELTFFAEKVQWVRKYEKTNQIGETEEVEPKWGSVNLREPPSPTALKKKRKRASEALGNGSPTHIPPPPSPETAHGGRSASYARRKTGHSDSPIARARSPLRPNETEVDGYTSEESLNLDRGPMSPPLVRPHHQSPHLQSQQQGHHVERQTNLAADRKGTLHILTPEKAGGGKSEVKHMGDALKGLTVHIIHIKDTLSDGPSQGDVILGQLRAGGKESGLGCEFDVTSCGESIWI